MEICKKRALSFILTLALLVGCFAGTGLTARAAGDRYLIQVRVVDRQGNPLKGVVLKLQTYSGDETKAEKASDENGMWEYQTNTLSSGTFKLVLASSEYKAITDRILYMVNYQGAILSINSEDWTGEENIEFVVAEKSDTSDKSSVTIRLVDEAGVLVTDESVYLNITDEGLKETQPSFATTTVKPESGEYTYKMADPAETTCTITLHPDVTEYTAEPMKLTVSSTGEILTVNDKEYDGAPVNMVLKKAGLEDPSINKKSITIQVVDEEGNLVTDSGISLGMIQESLGTFEKEEKLEDGVFTYNTGTNDFSATFRIQLHSSVTGYTAAPVVFKTNKQCEITTVNDTPYDGKPVKMTVVRENTDPSQMAKISGLTSEVPGTIGADGTEIELTVDGENLTTGNWGVKIEKYKKGTTEPAEKRAGENSSYKVTEARKAKVTIDTNMSKDDVDIKIIVGAKKGGTIEPQQTKLITQSGNSRVLLSVKLVDANSSSVTQSGLELVSCPEDYKDYGDIYEEPLRLDSESGEYIFEPEEYESGNYIIEMKENDLGYEMDPHTVRIASSYYVITEVDGNVYDGNPVSFQVTSQASDDPVVITGVKASPETVPASGGTIELAVEGTGLTQRNLDVKVNRYKKGVLLSDSDSRSKRPTVTMTENGATVEIGKNTYRDGLTLEFVVTPKGASDGNEEKKAAAVQEGNKLGGVTIRLVDQSGKLITEEGLSLEGRNKSFPLSADGKVVCGEKAGEFVFEDIDGNADPTYEISLAGGETLGYEMTPFEIKTHFGEIREVGKDSYTGAPVDITVLKKGAEDDDKDPAPPVKPQTPQPVKVGSISLSAISGKIAAGRKIQMTAAVSPANAANKTVIYKSSNTKYAAVSASGKVTVKKAGAGKTVTITATAADGSGKSASYRIKIMKNAVKSVKIKGAKAVKAGRKLKLKTVVKTTGKKVNKKLKWTSSNSRYASVSSSGVVKAKKAGKGKAVKITAMATDGSNKKSTVRVKIK